MGIGRASKKAGPGVAARAAPPAAFDGGGRGGFATRGLVFWGFRV